MSDTNTNEALRDTLEDIVKNINRFASHIEKEEDSIMVIGSVDDGRKVRNIFTIAGSEGQLSHIVYQALKKDKRVVEIMLSAMKQYFDEKVEDIAPNIIKSIASDLIQNCQCPKCVERRRNNNTYGN